MSTTSGPTDPDRIGNSMLRPSGSLRLACLSTVFSLSTRPEAPDDLAQARFVLVAAAVHDVPQLVVRELEQLVQTRQLLGVQSDRLALQEALEHQIELEQPAAAFPLQTIVRQSIHHTARRIMSSLIFPIASVGLRFFGQASTQFMMV